MRHALSTRWVVIIIPALAALLESAGRACAQNVEQELKALKHEIEALRRSEAEKQRRLDELERRLEQLQAQPPAPPRAAAPRSPAPTPGETAASALDRAIEALAAPQPTPAQGDVWSRPVGAGTARLIDISLDTLLAVGTSTATDDEIEGGLEAGAHDPQRRGFTLQQAEVSFTGAVDPYLAGEAHVVYTPDEVELEEAFMTSTALPYGLRLKGGLFLAEFGIINAQHPHAWDWVDVPVISSRLFGPESLRSPGARLSWLTPLPWYAEVLLGVQNADNGESTFSFNSGESIGGRPPVDRTVHNLGDMLYLARSEHFANLTETMGATLGVSGLHGPNSTGGDGDTWIYGTDLKLRWRPAGNFRGWPFFLWQSELMKRDYTAAAFPGDPSAAPPVAMTPRAILRDTGFYTQALYGFRYGWAGGLRFEYASGAQPSLPDGRESDPLRDDRYRVAPLMVWQPSEFSRFRLQYNYDNARHLPDRDAHSVWLGAEVLYGRHPAHKY
jgi:hypothetical protein